MTLPSFLQFTPVPLKPSHDGWSPGLQSAFILLLARGRSVAGAARGVGKSRVSAYALRDLPGAAGFTAAWDAALAHARRARIAARAARLPTPLPPHRRPGARDLPPGSPERQAFDRLLAALYPQTSGQTDEAGKTDTRRRS